MRVFQVVEFGKGEVKDLPIPEPKDDQILVRVHTAGICHSDLHIFQGDWPNAFPVPMPFALGHEGMGHVEKLGPNAGTGFKVGDRVIFGLGGAGGADWCGSCEFCLSGRTMLCDQSVALFGTFSDYMVIKQKCLVKLPDEVKDTDVSLACAGLTTYGAIKKIYKFGFGPGKTVAIVGAAGGLGHYAVQIAKAFGYIVVGLDVSEDKLEFVRKLGADYAFDVRTAVKEVNEQLGGVNASLVLSPRTDSYELSLQILKKGGVLVGVSLPAETERPVGVSQLMMTFKDMTYRTSLVGNVEEMRELVALAAAGKVKTELSRAIAIDEVPQVFHDMEEGKIKGRCIIDLINK